MFPRLRNAYVTVVALVCAVALAPVRGDEPCPNCTKCTKMVRKVVPVADLVVQVADCEAVNPISDILCRLDRPTGSVVLGDPIQSLLPAPVACESCLNCDLEIMCQQPGDEPCCQSGSCCQGASCCPNGACCPDGACCPKAGCCEKAGTNWTAIAAPEWHPPAAPKPQLQEQLIQLITKTVCPNCWADMGGSCTIDYYPLGMGLVVNAPPDVQEQIADLIEALRKLQDLEIACDVRLVAVADGPFQQALASDAKAKFESGQPVFLDAGELRTFMEALQSDRHTSVLQSPKLTVLNGQKAAVRCTQDQTFVTGMNVGMAPGCKITPDELRAMPKQPLGPGMADSCTAAHVQTCVPKTEGVTLGMQMSVRPTVSADHKFIRCELNAEYSELASVDEFPMTTFVTPIFEGGAQGQPIPFTQPLQQPVVVKRGISKSLTIPDGGTAVLYAGKRTKEDASAENDSALMFDWIYDLVDLFQPPTPAPTYDEHLLVLVTPRVIHAEEMDSRATVLPMPVGPQVAQCPMASPSIIPTAAPEPIIISGATSTEECVIHRQLPLYLPTVPTLAPVVRQCAAMADGPCVPLPLAPCCDPPAYPVAACPTVAAPPTANQPQVQLDVRVLSMDPAAWDQPATEAWADFSPKVCNGQPKFISSEEAERFCSSMKAMKVGECLAAPKIRTLNGSSAAFESDAHPGTKCALNILPILHADRATLEFKCEMLATLHRTVKEVRQFQFTAMVPTGRTMLMHCGRNAEGTDVMVMVTPRPLDVPVVSAPPIPAPPAQGCMAAGYSVMVPPPPCPAPAPACEPQLVTGFFGQAIDPKLDRLLTKYRWACEDGDAAEARKLAQQCLAIDPTCFGK